MKLKLAKLKTTNLRTAILIVALTLISYGCVAVTPPPPIQYRDVPQGMIKTEGVKIAAEDGSFVLRSGESFTTPFSNKPLWSSLNPPKSDGFKLCSGIGFCAKVKVTVAGKKKPLYGYLNFSKMFPNATGPGSRSYLIEIPERYIDEASGGRVSVVYELVNFYGNANKQAGWVIWLSDAPF